MPEWVPSNSWYMCSMPPAARIESSVKPVVAEQVLEAARSSLEKVSAGALEAQIAAVGVG
jgi:hypothetical protein